MFHHISLYKCHHVFIIFVPPTSSKYRTGEMLKVSLLPESIVGWVWSGNHFFPSNKLRRFFPATFAFWKREFHQISGNFGESQMETILIFRGQIFVLGSVYPKKSCLNFCWRSPCLIIFKKGIIYMFHIFYRSHHLSHLSPQQKLGGDFKYLFIFTSPWGNDPIFYQYFSDGLVHPPRCRKVSSTWFAIF